MDIQVQKLNKKAILPKMMRSGDAAIDLYSVEEVKVKASDRVVIKTGIALAIPQGYWGNIRDRSGLAVKHGLHTLAGVVDSNYRGEVIVAMINLSKEDYLIKQGDRVAQMIIAQHEDVILSEVNELGESNRGDKMLSSSGY